MEEHDKEDRKRGDRHKVQVKYKDTNEVRNTKNDI